MRNFLKNHKKKNAALLAALAFCATSVCAKEAEMCKKYNEFIPNYTTELNGAKNQGMPIMMSIKHGRRPERGLIDIEAEVYPECYGPYTAIRVTQYGLEGYKKSAPHKYTVMPKEGLDRIGIKTSRFDKETGEIVAFDAKFEWEHRWNPNKRTLGDLVYGKIVSGKNKGKGLDVLLIEHAREEVIESLNLQKEAEAKFYKGAPTTPNSQKSTYRAQEDDSLALDAAPEDRKTSPLTYTPYTQLNNS